MKNFGNLMMAVLVIIALTMAFNFYNKANKYHSESLQYKEAAEFYSQKSDKYQKLCDKVFLSTVEEVSDKEILNYVDSLSALNSESCPVAVILNSNK